MYEYHTLVQASGHSLVVLGPFRFPCRCGVRCVEIIYRRPRPLTFTSPSPFHTAAPPIVPPEPSHQPFDDISATLSQTFRDAPGPSCTLFPRSQSLRTRFGAGKYWRRVRKAHQLSYLLSTDKPWIVSSQFTVWTRIQQELGHIMKTAFCGSETSCHIVSIMQEFLRLIIIPILPFLPDRTSWTKFKAMRLR